ncbi:1-phosphofructokinase family hexose kinase [Tellurirhabdus rosea]|uniref:1-phosphofructokinase family hexose kinase n=1 Tax=Tellurirhabdus rosea TaxID=2674997 RepID=UPI00224E01EB|nr:1-phosphofructokinase family hexose kinase [Tellurirhabdus rosea]
MNFDVLTITLNPAIDKSTTVDRFVPEQKLRCAPPRYDAGGGGLNVSKALRRLGGDSLALFSAGGPPGQLLQDLVRKAGISYRIIETQEWTRENFTVTETESNAQYRFNLPGPTLSASEAQSWLDSLSSLDFKPAYVVASGSLPNGVSTDFYARIARAVQNAGARFILDTSGQPLFEAANVGVFLLKPNLNELCALVGVETLETVDIDDAAREIIGRGDCEVVVVSMGPQGAMLVTRDFCEHVPAPSVKKLSTVGAGDSMVAGMTWALSQGRDYRQMIRQGVACGSAATMNPGTELFQPQDVERLLAWINQYGTRYRLPTDCTVD